MTGLSSSQQSAPSRSLAFQLIPPRQRKEEEEQEISLEAAMQSLVLDKRHPVALELAGTHESRSFIVRATTPVAIDHIEAQLRTLYPQLDVRPLEPHEDPFRLDSHEAISAIELQAGGASYLPLRTWEDPEEVQEGSDPILGLLAALSKLPYGIRAIAQIALIPARPDWSKRFLRKAVEEPLEKEKRKFDAEKVVIRAGGDYAGNFASTIIILTLTVLLGFLLLIYPFVPRWAWQAIILLIQAKNPHLTAGQSFLLLVSTIGLIGVSFLLLFGLRQLPKLLNLTPIYHMEQVAQKTSRPAYRVCIRLYAIGPAAQERGEHSLLPSVRNSLKDKQASEQEREEVLLRLIAAYRQYHLASGAYFVPKRISTVAASRLLGQDTGMPGCGWQRGLTRSRHLLSVDALAALWHLPPAQMLPDLALMDHRRARSLLMPPDVARNSAGLTPAGYSEHGGYRLPFALTSQFFTAHTLIGGKSGEGKSTCMEHIACEAMKVGALVLIDPHGDLCDHVLQLVPPHRADDTILIDLSDGTASVGINPLDVTLGRGRDKAISDLMKTFSNIWMEAWGPRMENAFEMALRTLFEANKVLVAQDGQNGPLKQYTLLDVMPLLTNESFCHALLQQVRDDYLHRWWREYYEPMTLMQQRDVVIPVLSKVTKFESEVARRIIGQGASTLNFTAMIAERKIILMKLAKGIVGADIAAIVGATLLSLIQITLEEQGAKSEAERVRLPIMLDEFQVLAGADYAALAELRKYGATFFLATQSLEYLQKLDPVLLPTVLANVRQLIIFHMSAQDAETLYPELGVEADDILNLDTHMCYVKMPAGVRRQPTFSLKMLPPSQGDPLLAESIRTRCRLRYTRRVEEIDQLLREAMIRNIRLLPTPTMPPGGRKQLSDRLPAGGDDLAPDNLPSLLMESDDEMQLDAGQEAGGAEGTREGRKRRPRRHRTKGKKVQQTAHEERGKTTPMAFSEDVAGELEMLGFDASQEDAEDDGNEE